MFRSARSATGALAVVGLAAGVLALQAPVSAGTPAFRLQLLHASDLEGGVAAIDRAPNFAAIVDALEYAPGMGASITLSAGDNYIPGPFFSAAGDPSVVPALAAANGLASTLASAGRADASIMNVVGFDASALGNHEFDLGSREVRNIIAATTSAGVTWPGVQFPYLSGNLNFAGDADLNSLFQAPPSILASSAYRTGGAAGTRKIAPYTVIEEGGERIGVVGATTPILQTISSPTGTTVIGPNTNDMPALAAVLQPRIDELIATGVNKVVLVSHLQQISLEQTLAPLLTGVDAPTTDQQDAQERRETDHGDALDALAQPQPLIAVLDVHVFDADGVAVGVAQVGDQFAQLRLRRHPGDGIGGEFAIEVGFAQPVGRRVEL